MKILIYDDNIKDRNHLIECIQNLFLKKKINYEIITSSNTVDFLQKAEKCDLIFLDIVIGNENGIQIGLKLNNLLNNPRIIITSQYTKYLIDGYKIHADRYFIKPIKQDEFNIEMENVLNRYFQQHVGFLDSTICQEKIYLKDILYIEYDHRRTLVHFINDNIISTTYPLKYWISKLSGFSFGQPHKSFLVNFSHISGFSNQDIILINEELIPLSRHYKKEFDKKYIERLHKLL